MSAFLFGVSGKLKTLLDRPASPIKSIQRGVYQFEDNTVSTENITISAVDMDKAMVHVTWSNPSTSFNRGIRGRLTSTTNLALSRGSINTFGPSVTWEVVEYN